MCMRDTADTISFGRSSACVYRTQDHIMSGLVKYIYWTDASKRPDTDECACSNADFLHIDVTFPALDKTCQMAVTHATMTSAPAEMSTQSCSPLPRHHRRQPVLQLQVYDECLRRYRERHRFMGE